MYVYSNLETKKNNQYDFGSGFYSKQSLIEKISHNHLLHLSKDTDNNEAFYKKLEEIPVKIQEICFDVYGDTIHTVIAATLITAFSQNPFQALNRPEEGEFNLKRIFNYFSIENELLIENSENYLINMGIVINKLLSEQFFITEEKFTLKSMEKILDNAPYERAGRILVAEQDPSLLAISKAEFDLIKDQFNPNFNVPPYLYEKDDQYKLRLMLFMTSLDQKTRLECIDFYINQMEKGVVKITPPKNPSLFTLLAYVSKKDRMNILSSILQSSEKVKIFIKSHLTFSHILIEWNKSPNTRADILIENFLLLVPMTHLQNETTLSENISHALENTKKNPETPMQKTKEFIIKEEDVIFGRTVLRKNKYAYKIQKKGESIESFWQELSVLKILHSSEFVSMLPKPKHILIRPIDLKGKITLEIEKQPLIYKFSTTKEYYHYLHTISDESDYKKGRKMWLQDSLKLLRNGWFHESTPMYHNQSQKRPYIILAKQLRAVVDFKDVAAGRLDTPRLFNQHPNVGQGIRDVGDIRKVFDIAQFPSIFSQDLAKGQDSFEWIFSKNETRKIMLTANFIATHRLVDTILLAMRLENDKNFKWDWRNQESIQYVAKQGIIGMALTIEAYSGKDYQQCYQIAESGLDWNQWAKELLFWWTPDQPDNYSNYIENGTLPDNFYPEGSSINIKQCKNYLPGFGFCNVEKVQKILEKRKKQNPEFTVADLRRDPEAKLYLDLGAYNSSLLLHHLELDAYLTATLALFFAETSSSL